MRTLATIGLTAWAILCGASGQGLAQQTTVSTPLNSVSDSFSESFGVNWGFNRTWPNGSMFFNFGGPAAAPFGGLNPGAGARFGFGTRGNGGGFRFNFSAAQSSSRQINSVTPMVTVPNGGTGFIMDSTVRPFVTGVVPVVGAGGPAPRVTSPLTERLERLRQLPPGPPAVAPAAPAAEPAPLQLGRGPSSAERGDLSLAEIRRQQGSQGARQTDELRKLIADARAAEAAGRFGAARIRYANAAAKASGEQRRALKQKLEELQDK